MALSTHPRRNPFTHLTTTLRSFLSQIVFFNKIDIFAEKLPRSPLTNYFPDYKGDNEDYPAACDFIKNKFLSMYRGEEASEKLHSFLTCATDSRQIQSECGILERTSLNF